MMGRRNTQCCARIGVVLIVTFLMNVPCLAQSRYYKGYLLHPQGSNDCNPCVDNVIHAVNTLSARGETLGFWMGAGHLKPTGSGTKRHWQGIQRLSIIPGTRLGVPHLAVSSSHREQEPPYSRFALVKMESRDNSGLRLRSNRLEIGKLTHDVAPSPLDRVVESVVISTEYNHPGGMQAIGKYLFVGSDGNIGHGRNTALFTLWDMTKNLAQPDNPVFGFELPGQNANSVGIVRLEDGRYLMVRALLDARELEFYISRSSNIEENESELWWELWDWWHFGELQTELGNNKEWADLSCGDIPFIGHAAGYQNTNLVTDCRDGRLYLIASHGRCPAGGGGDFVDVFRIDMPYNERPANQSNYRNSGVGAIITKVAKRHMFPSGNAGNRQGDFQAAAGAYISPDNKLYFYATEHGVTDKFNGVEMIEFGPEIPRLVVKTIDEAWVKLYEHRDFQGRSIILDYADRNLRNYNNFDEIEQFDNLASSIIYAIPKDYHLTLFEHDARGGAFEILEGTGTVVRIPDLKDVQFGSKDAGDKFSSAAWNHFLKLEVWVNLNYTGQIRTGSELFPFTTIEKGMTRLLPGGTLRIKSGTNDEILSITKPNRIEAIGGSVLIEQ